MGAAESKIEETNWQNADGGLKTALETLDGSKPVDGYRQVSLVKRVKLKSSQEYDVLADDEESLLYATNKVPGTLTWFDVADGLGKTLFRVMSSPLLGEWYVYTLGKPNYDGQTPDDEATNHKKNAGASSLYLKAKLVMSENRCRGEMQLVMDPEHQEDGSGSSPPILKVEWLKGWKVRYQTLLPDDSSAVGHWSWKDQSTKHPRMELHVAKGTDLVLHVILAVACNMVLEGCNSAAVGAAGIH